MGWNLTKTQGENTLRFLTRVREVEEMKVTKDKGKDSSLSVCVRKGIDDNWREGKCKGQGKGE